MDSKTFSRIQQDHCKIWNSLPDALSESTLAALLVNGCFRSFLEDPEWPVVLCVSSCNRFKILKRTRKMRHITTTCASDGRMERQFCSSHCIEMLAKFSSSIMRPLEADSKRYRVGFVGHQWVAQTFIWPNDQLSCNEQQSCPYKGTIVTREAFKVIHYPSHTNHYFA